MLNIKEEVSITSLKKVRQKKGLTQEEIAQKTKVAIRTYQRFEAGERIPDVHTAQRIADELGEEIKDLFPLPTGTSLLQ